MTVLTSFYGEREANTTEEKIQALEKQLQQFPNQRMNQDERLRQLEMSYCKMINYKPEQQEKRTKDWATKYKEVNDTPVDGTPGVGPVEAILKDKEHEVYNPYDGRSHFNIEKNDE